MEIVAAQSLIQLTNHFRGTQVLARPQPRFAKSTARSSTSRTSRAGERQARARSRRRRRPQPVDGRPAGLGQIHAAARAPHHPAPLTPAELLEVSMIASVAGEIEGGALTNRRPFRSPHHSAACRRWSAAACARAGRSVARASWRAVPRRVPRIPSAGLDSLRQPLETGEVAIARASYRVTYPARFMLVAAMNPCRCGRASEPASLQARSERALRRDYQARLSGPLLDRIDLHIEVPPSLRDLILPPPAEGSREVAERVARARTIQADATRDRLAARAHQFDRARAAARRRRRPDAAGLSLLRDAADAMRLSARAITACCAWRARSPISTAPRRSAACISPKRCPTARWPTRCEGRRERCARCATPGHNSRQPFINVNACVKNHRYASP